MLRRITGTFALIGTVLAAPAARAQSPAEILDTAMERYREQVADVDNDRVTREAMGFETTSTLEKMLDSGEFTVTVTVQSLETNVDTSN